jgi:FkbM family methyltransferase
MVSLALRRALVGTVLGRMATRSRRLLEIWRTMTRLPEQGGMVSQDVCAEMLLGGLCRRDHVFVDVGAHIGSVIADVLHHVPDAGVIAVEAVPEKAEALRRKFPKATIHACAVSEEEGETSFFVDELRPGYSSLAARDESQMREIRVQIHRLDDLVPDDAAVDLVKVDVEGAELGVLRGAESLFARCRPTVIFESGNKSGARLGFTREGLFRWFDEHDYDVLVPNRVAHDAAALSEEGFIESHAYPRRTLNYVAVARERRTEIRDRARKIMGVRVD